MVDAIDRLTKGAEMMAHSLVVVRNQVDKVDLLTIYTQIRPTVLIQQNIQAGFQATGLIPPCPDTVQPRSVPKAWDWLEINIAHRC